MAISSDLLLAARQGSRLGAACRRVGSAQNFSAVSSDTIRAQIRVVGIQNALSSFKSAVKRKGEEERDQLLRHYTQAIHKIHGAREALTFINDALADGVPKYTSDVFASFFARAVEDGEDSRVVNDARKLMAAFNVGADTECTVQMVRALASANEVDTVLQIMLRPENAKMWKNVDIYNSVLTAAAAHGDFRSVEIVLGKIRDSRIPANPAMFNTLIRVCSESGDMGKAQRVLSSMREHGFRPSLIAFNALLSGYTKLHDMDGVDRTFEDMRHSLIQPDTMTYNTILSARLYTSNFDEVVALFERMSRLRVEPDEVTLELVIRALFALNKASVVPELVGRIRRKYELSSSSELVNELISGYVKSDMTEEALQTVETATVEQVAVSPHVLAALAHRFSLHRRPKEASNVIALIGQDHWGAISEETIERVIRLNLEEDNLNEAHRYVQAADKLGYKGAEVLSLSLKLYCQMSNVTKVEEAMKVLSALRPLTSRELCWALSVLSRASHIYASMEAFSALGKCNDNDCPESELACALNDYLALQLKQRNRENLTAALELTRKLGVELRPNVQAGLIRDKLALGDAQSARAMLHELNYADSDICHEVLKVFAEEGNVNASFSVTNCLSRMGLNWEERTYASLILAHGRARKLPKAEELFETMLRKEAERIRPSSVTHNALLLAYAWNHRERDAILHMDRMRRYNLSVNVESYEALVQMYLNRKQIDRAERLFHYIRRTGVQPKSATVRAMITAYSQNDDLEGARRAESMLIELGLTSDVHSYNDILQIYSKRGRAAEILNALQQIRNSGAAPNSLSYLHFTHACKVSRQGLMLKNFVDEMPLGSELQAALVRTFTACEDYQQAVNILQTSKGHVLEDETTLNAQLLAYSKTQRLSTALQVCRLLTRKSLSVDTAAYDALIELIIQRRGRSNVSAVLKDAGINTSSSSFAGLINKRRKFVQHRDSPVKGLRDGLPTIQKSARDEGHAVSLVDKLHLASRKENHGLVMKLLKGLQKGGLRQLQTETFRNVLKSIILAGTAKEAEIAIEEALERSLKLSVSACEEAHRKFSEAGMISALQKLLKYMEKQGTATDLQKVQLFELQLKQLQLSDAKIILAQIPVSDEFDSAAVNKFYRLLMQKQIESADPAGAMATFEMLERRWNVDFEKATLSLAIEACSTLGDLRSLSTILRFLRGHSGENLANEYSDLVCTMANAGNLRAVESLVGEMKRQKLNISDSGERCIREALTRSGEARAAMRWNRTRPI
eukprot:Plantae.Rhodophyta-Purpureofilum_apyrenoidigerum.ctg12471.p1 GENE.Plantae.Rhodophyta-Purpureofilum_apyrenoidigerum.ctg12471~~Plantae.Rhodophyta-Purpureofilum_apyrenoidigerum.ctg12471.p1  ORF type:complete len:1258 (-),score=232.01 Plantae.Rhodophyta-Purpureofilum_apyrenoidigerum.ctg12471:71-3844(-)